MLNKFVVLIIFSLIFIFSGCVTSLSDSNISQRESLKTATKVKLDKDALYIKSNYLLLKKMDINLSNIDEKKVILDYLKSLIYDTYNKKFFIKQKVFKSDNILMFTLTLKDSFWKNDKKSIINEKCFRYFKDLKKLENYINNPTKLDSYYYGSLIRGMNKVCYTVRMGGGNCKIIHNINELYKFYKQNYKKCINKYENDKVLRETKILIKLTYIKKGNVDGIIINVVKKRLSDNSTIKEKYVVLKSKKKLYILSLNKKSKFSKIFNKKLRELSYDDLIEIKNIFN